MRTPDTDEEQVFDFADDDPFYSEVDTFIDVVEGKIEADAISSSYEGEYFVLNIVVLV